MLGFFMIFFFSVAMLLAAQAMDVECVRQRSPRRGRGFANRFRAPLRLPFRDMLQSLAR